MGFRRTFRDKPPSEASGNEHPGCVWGLLHIMKYHHWHHVKKRLVYRKRGGNKTAAATGVEHHRNCGDDACSFQSMKIDKDAKIDTITTAEDKMNQSGPAAKTSVKARLRARIVEELAKKRGRHHRTSSSPLRSQLTRTESMHRSDSALNVDPIAEMVLNEASPVNVAHGIKERSSYEEPRTSGNTSCPHMSPMSVAGDSNVNHDQVIDIQNDHALDQEQLDNDMMQDMLDKKLIHVKELDTDSSVHHPKEYLDALDIINVNKELLVKILHDPGSPLAQHFQNQQAVSAKMSLTMSESFSTPGSLDKFGSESSKRKSKYELKDGSPAPKPTWSASLKYAGEGSGNSFTDYNLDSSSSPCHASPKRQGENPAAMKRFKDLRQKIKHVIKESDQERHVISMDAILHKIPHGQKLTKELEKEIVSQTKDPALHREGKDSPSSYGSDLSSVSPFKKNKMRQMRRVSSLDASLDRYRRLYETTSFNKESKCHPSSERLKVRTEGSGSSFRSTPSRKVPKNLGRIFSLPDMESYYQCEECTDGFLPGPVLRTGQDGNANRKSRFGDEKRQDNSFGSENELQLNSPIAIEVQGNLANVTETDTVARDKLESTSVRQVETSSEVGLNFDECEKLAAVNSISHQGTQPSVEAIVNVADPFPLSMTAFSTLQNTSSSRNLWQSEGEELEPMREDGIGNLENKQGKMPENDTPEVVSVLDAEEVEAPRKHSNYDMTHVRVNEKDKIEFNYVRDVLEFSGFSGNECRGTWRADDPPVHPLVYEGVEGCFVLDPDCAGNQEGGECDHLLLFNLINEVLVEIYGRSYNYCPKVLSSLCNIRLMPAGHHVLKEVWSLISWYLSLTQEVDQSLDYVMSKDLAKNDGWMNLQFDSECIGIELEDLIFDELLEGAIWD